MQSFWKLCCSHKILLNTQLNRCNVCRYFCKNSTYGKKLYNIIRTSKNLRTIKSRFPINSIVSLILIKTAIEWTSEFLQSQKYFSLLFLASVMFQKYKEISTVKRIEIKGIEKYRVLNKICNLWGTFQMFSFLQFIMICIKIKFLLSLYKKKHQTIQASQISVHSGHARGKPTSKYYY